MAATARRRQANDFDIHEDGLSTEDTEMNTDAAGEEDVDGEEDPDDVEGEGDGEEHEDEDQIQDAEPEAEPDSDQEQQGDDFSEDEAMDEDMRKLQDAFPGFKHKYRLIKRIGEGTLIRTLSYFVCASTNIGQAHSPPSTRLKICSTRFTTIDGTWTRRTRSGRPLHSKGTSIGAPLP